VHLLKRGHRCSLPHVARPVPRPVARVVGRVHLCAHAYQQVDALRPPLVRRTVQRGVSGCLHLVHAFPRIDQRNNLCMRRHTSSSSSSKIFLSNTYLRRAFGIRYLSAIRHKRWRGSHQDACDVHLNAWLRPSSLSLLWLLTALWISIFPTVPRPRCDPPPSSLQPIGPSQFGNGPDTLRHQGFFSTMMLRVSCYFAVVTWLCKPSAPTMAVRPVRVCWPSTAES
jgi:hypothetical protein